MSSSGIKFDESVGIEYGKLSSGKQKPYRYIIFKIEKDSEGYEYTKVVVEKTGGRDKTFADMKADLDKDAPRYVVFDIAYHTAGEQQLREKIVFIKFVPSTTGRQAKMVYSSTEKELKQTLGNASISKSFHFEDHSEINEDVIVKEMAKQG